MKKAPGKQDILHQHLVSTHTLASKNTLI